MQCTLCPLSCGTDRSKKAGACGVGGLRVAKYYLHPFEEPPISCEKGSGTVFFCGCSLRCVFCQNYEVSRAKRGKAVTCEELADIFRELEGMGAENINLVTPDHVSHLIAKTLTMYEPDVPIVYNSSGYCKTGSLEEIDPHINVYLPDLKFYSPELSERYTGRRDYFDYASKAIARMAKKPVVFDGGKMVSGILVRHLVMPSATSDSRRVLDFLHEVLPKNAPVSLMRQYTPMGVSEYAELNRTVTNREYRRVVDYALSLGFEKIYIQEKESAGTVYIPAWDY